MKHSNDINQEEEKFKEGFGFIILIVVITIALLTILKYIIG
jgi:flagellar basal body-associated protein FliL